MTSAVTVRTSALTGREVADTVGPSGVGFSHSTGPAKEATVKDIRCLVGVHAWSTDLPAGVVPPFNGPALVCQRCGRLKRHTGPRPDLNANLPPEAYGGG
jgi:hypothetical protein